MRFIARFFAVFFVLLVAGVGGLYFYLQNAERLKPDLEAFILEQTGVEVALDGPLNWQLFPPLELQMSDVRVRDQELDAQAEMLSLSMDLSAMWEDVNRWKITDLELTNATVTNASGTTTFSSLKITDFTPGEPANLSVAGAYQGEGESEPIPGTLDGMLTYLPGLEDDGDAIRLTDATITSTNVSALCSVDAKDNGAAIAAAGSDEDLLPVAQLKRYDVVADCDLNALTVGTETFSYGSVKLTSMSDTLNVYLEIEDFLGGALFTEVDVDLSTQPIRWKIMPEMERVDSQRLVDWSNRSIHWVAPLALQGEIEMRGNSEPELMNSIRSEQDFNGGQGEIDITALKAQLAQLATLTGSSDSFAKWPDKWAYQTMTGKLLTRGKQQVLNLQLDNLFIEGDGTYDYVNEEIDMLANVTFKEALEGSPYTVNPILQDTPLPVRCRGAASDVSCKLDSGATKELIAGALRSDSDTGLRRKLEDKIEEEVPEEYRDAARGLLDILGRALENN